MTNSAGLTHEDVSRLVRDQSAGSQMAVVEKIASLYTEEKTKGFSEGESAIANDIFRLLLNHAEVQVRSLLAESLSKSAKVPPEIVKQICSDVAEVAAPVLENSTVLADEDLLAIIQENGDIGKLQAIARRDTVSETISDALVDTKVEVVVNTLVKNEGAKIAETTFMKISENHATSAEVMTSLFERESVPVAVVEKVIEKLSGTMRETLEKKFGNLAEMKEVRRNLELSLEWMGLKMMGLKSSEQDMARLLRHLEGESKLSLFFALSMGELQLFQVTLARALRLPFKKVQQIMNDRELFRAAFIKAEMPESMFEAAELAVKAIQELEAQSIKTTGAKQHISPNQLIEQMHRLSAGQEIEGLDYLYAIMRHNAGKASRNNSQA